VNARLKLNRFHTMTCLAIAGIASLATQSVSVFVVLLVMLIGLNLYSGEIRVGTRGKSNKRHRRRRNQ
jgi:hypothetical protein